MNIEISKFTKKDFTPDGEVKWCSGCGDFSILAQAQKVLAETGRSPDEFAFISGIGCSSRFPYYVNSYGYHTIHGRALAVATGTKTFNPDLSVWVAMGDGDGLSIGGNHFLHAVRKNVDLVCILMDNRIYGLTKGQFSPTTDKGQVTKTSPYGTLESPVDPVSLTLGIGGSFVARATDRNPKEMQRIFKAAYEHKGFSLVHVLQNCVIFNDDCFNRETGSEKLDNTLQLVQGEPMIFGKENDKAIVRDGFSPKVVNKADVDPSEILVHDENADDPGLALFLSSMNKPELPTPLGIFRKVSQGTYDEDTHLQLKEITAKKGKGDLQTLLNSGDTWKVG
ncbi:MAG: 2-oxoacid:ferredoxin oxidoreductase subunit beta [Deltaproteobacteria bacterium]|nr:2-oxoacid:ferredoxin oxidoreductase subunit beta [Deltaproteobacteria bacterium]